MLLNIQHRKYPQPFLHLCKYIGILICPGYYTYCTHLLYYNVDSFSTLARASSKSKASREGIFCQHTKGPYHYSRNGVVGGWKAGPANGAQARAQFVHERRPNDNRTQAQRAAPRWCCWMGAGTAQTIATQSTPANTA